jgi:putative ABC transport system substrate-binding protein
MDSHRRALLAALAAAGLVVPVRGLTQARKTPVIGLLWNDSVKPSPYVAIFVAAMRDRGYVLSRDFRIEDRVTLEGYSGYAESAADLVRAKVDVVVVNGATGVVAAAKATNEIPIVMIIGSDPVAAGLVRSLGRPGGNLTGVVTLTAGLNAKRIELLKELNPRLSTVGVLFASNAANPANVRESQAAAHALNLQLHFKQVSVPEDIEGAVAELAKMRVGALYIGPSTMLSSYSARVVEIVAKHRIPAVFGAERSADDGALLTYAGGTKKAFVRAASYVERILKGARAGDLAIEQAGDLVEMTVNLKTARALGIKIPQSILVRADQVIE